MILYILLTCACDVLLCVLEKCLVNRGAKVHKITQKTKFPNPKQPLFCMWSLRDASGNGIGFILQNVRRIDKMLTPAFFGNPRESLQMLSAMVWTVFQAKCAQIECALKYSVLQFKIINSKCKIDNCI